MGKEPPRISRLPRFQRPLPSPKETRPKILGYLIREIDESNGLSKIETQID